jgi:hypothetical protein
MLTTPSLLPSRRVGSARTAARACWSSSACSPAIAGSHQERQRCRGVPLCRQHRGHGSPEPWLPATLLPASRNPSLEAPFPLALWPPDPTP